MHHHNMNAKLQYNYVMPLLSFCLQWTGDTVEHCTKNVKLEIMITSFPMKLFYTLLRFRTLQVEEFPPSN